MDETRLIDGAIEAIADRGLGSLTLASVAKHAGVSRASVYRIFGSRSALINAVVEREIQTMLTIIRTRIGLFDDPRYTVRLLVREVLDYLGTHRALRAVLTHDAADLTPWLVERGDGHPTLIEAVTGTAVSQLAGTDLAEHLWPTPDRAVEHIVRVIFAHLLVPSSRMCDDDIANLVTAAVVRVAVTPSVTPHAGMA